MAAANIFFNKLLANDLTEGVWQNKLNGSWQDQWGWDFISQPNSGQPGPSDFHMRSDVMRETIKFKKIGVARNIGVEGEEGFWESIAYEIDIRNPNINDHNSHPDGKGIHHEMGHFLLKVKSEESPEAIPHENGRVDVEEVGGSNVSGIIIRQATIPRANSFMTHGKLDIGSIADLSTNDFNEFYSPKAKSAVVNPSLQSKIDAEISRVQDKVNQQNGPNILELISHIQTVDNNQLGEIKAGTLDWVFSFKEDAEPSQMASGQRVPHPVGIGNLLSDFWVGERVLEGQEIEILQYAQKVNIKFNNTEWPHVAINTLIKQGS